MAHLRLAYPKKMDILGLFQKAISAKNNKQMTGYAPVFVY
jgi:hypothetical protein